MKDMKPVTKINISQIAKIANVSKATVSRVINDADCVKPETRDKVLRVMNEYDYVPNSIAQSLSSSRPKAIGVVIPDMENLFFLQVLSGITHIADQNGYEIMMFNTDEQTGKEHRILKAARGSSLAGLIIAPVDYKDTETAQILGAYEASGVPVILLDRDLKEGNFSKILASNRRGSYEAVKYLISQGHKRIGFLKGYANITPVIEREEGYIQALNEAGIPVLPQYLLECDQFYETAYSKMSLLMSQPEPPTAIFTSNNMMTLGCIRYLTEHNLRIGSDIALIGFDDIMYLNMINFRLSVVTRSEEQMGIMAMGMILSRINGTKAEHVSQTIDTELILRGSEKCSVL